MLAMSIQTVSPASLRPRSGSLELIDVRTPAEFETVHAAGAQSVPLDRLDPGTIIRQRKGSGDEPIYLICKSGSRAARACETFAAAGFTNVYSVEGGTEAWERAGLPDVRGTTRVISLERQVRICAGLLVLIGVTLGWFVHPAFFALAGFIGAGLTFSGMTDWCGMAMILAKMPWNRGNVGAKY